MHFFHRLACLSRNLFHTGHVERELDEELHSYFEQLAEEKIAAGISPDQARRQARIELGGLEQIKEQVRETRAGALLHSLTQDVRYALRTLRKNPSFAAAAVLTLGLGIGANTAVFSLVNTLLLRTLPVRAPAQLVELLHRYPGEPRLNGFSWRTYELMRENNHVLSDLTAACYQSFHVRGEGIEPQTIEGAYVNGTFFTALGLGPEVGRLIGPDDELPGDTPSAVAVVSWSYWKNVFHLDPAILGKKMIVDDTLVTIVGVGPRKFSGMQIESRQDVWLPLSMAPVAPGSDRGPGSLWLVGRLKPGISLQQASAELALLYESTLDEQAKITNNPFLRKMKFEMAPAGAGLSRLREDFAKPSLMLMAVVAILLLIACGNVAGLVLARGAARQHEMALRVSLGASRPRLVRQVLTEALLLSAAGSLLGIWLAYFGTDALVHIIHASRHPGPPLDFQARIDGNVLTFTAAAGSLTGLLFGFVPALRASGSAPADALRQATSGGETMFGRRFGSILVVIQVACSIVLLSAAAFFVHHMSNLERADLGFQRDHVLLLTLDPAHSGYRDENLSRAYRELLAHLETIPGVRSASICASSPIQGSGANRAAAVEGYEPKPGEIRNINENWVAPRYFQTLGTPFLAGRDFSSHDPDSSRTAIVNQSMARYYFGDDTPIGKHITFDGDDQRYEIVGEVSDAKYFDIRENPWRTIYLNAFQRTTPPSQFVLRTSVAPQSIALEAQRAVREVLKTVSVKRITTLSDQIDSTIVPERLIAGLSGGFGAFGALLAAIGLYGLLAYTVARRTNEIGVRIALGATRVDMIHMVLKDAFAMVSVGLLVGAPFAYWGKRFAASLMQGLPVSNAAPIVFGAAAMFAVALLAAYLPARRASRVDPIVALRYE
jgi:putative ABC transport system permease protein